MIKNSKLYTIDEKKGTEVLVGDIVADSLFLKKKDAHFMRVVGGYGIQESAFNELKDNGIVNIFIHNIDSRKDYYSTTEDWEKHGKTADYGHGRQVFLSLKYMGEHNES